MYHTHLDCLAQKYPICATKAQMVAQSLGRANKLKGIHKNASGRGALLCSAHSLELPSALSFDLRFIKPFFSNSSIRGGNISKYL